MQSRSGATKSGMDKIIRFPQFNLMIGGHDQQMKSRMQVDQKWVNGGWFARLKKSSNRTGVIGVSLMWWSASQN